MKLISTLKTHTHTHTHTHTDTHTHTHTHTGQTLFKEAVKICSTKELLN